jgi:tetratricopeptide (TPR) repeat protein
MLRDDSAANGGRSAICPSLVIMAAVALVYGQALTFGFVWDDHHFLVDNDQIKDLANLPSFFGQETDDLYRPLRTALYAIAYSVFGLNPALYHAMGLLFHVAASLLVFEILKLCGVPKNASLFGALVFALHPVHSEKFIFITAAFDLPADLLVLAALWVYLRGRDSQTAITLAGSALFFGIGLFFAENAAVYPFLWVLVQWLGFGATYSQRWKQVIYVVGLGLILAFYALIRLLVLGRFSRPIDVPDYWATQAAMMLVYLTYWRLLVFPYPLSPANSLSDLTRAFCHICSLAGVLNAAMIAIGFLLRKQAPLIALGIGWFYVALLPNSNLLPAGTLMAERYLYLPSVGLSFLLASLYSQGQLRAPFASSIIIMLAALSIYQAPAWKDEESLWKRAVSVVPTSELAWGNLAVLYQGQGRDRELIALYREMLRRGIKVDLAQGGIAAFAIDEGDYELAERYLMPLVERVPNDASSAANLVVARCQLNRPGWPEEAEATLALFPTAFLYEQVGNCWARIGETEKAIAAFSKALDLSPKNAQIQRKIDLLRR